MHELPKYIFSLHVFKDYRRRRRPRRGKSARPKRAKMSVDGSGTAFVGAKAKIPTEVRQAASMPLIGLEALACFAA